MNANLNDLNLNDLRELPLVADPATLEISDEEMDAQADGVLQLLRSGDTSVDTTTLARDIGILYRAAGYEPPAKGLAIHVADGPVAGRELAKSLLDDPNDEQFLDACNQVGIVWQSHWAAMYELLAHRCLAPNDVGRVHIEAMMRVIRAGVWDLYALDEGVVVIRRPCRFIGVDSTTLHCADGPVIEFLDGSRLYALDNVAVDGEHYRAPEAITPDGWAAMNTEVRRVLANWWGWAKYLGAVGAKLLDSTNIDGLSYELYDAPGTKLLRKQSPVLKTGEQPWYVEPVHVDLVSAAGARRWQVRDVNGRVLTPAEAELHPELTYDWEL